MIGPTGIWSDQEAKPENYPHSELLCFKLIFEVFDKEYFILDLGCGDGYYLNRFWQAGFRKLVGCDGYFLMTDFPRFPFLQKDLSEPCDLKIRGQVLSLEVGEHIPAQFEQIFINNICFNCHSRLVISWAVPGQEGIGHVNCRDNAYVIDQIEKRGFKFNPELTLYLRADIEVGVSYFRNTLMVFDKV